MDVLIDCDNMQYMVLECLGGILHNLKLGVEQQGKITKWNIVKMRVPSVLSHCTGLNFFFFEYVQSRGLADWGQEEEQENEQH